jgi:hypothetical protein
MSKFVEEGFLCTDMVAVEKRCHDQYKSWFELHESLNRYCLGILKKLAFHSDKKQEYVSIAIFIRMVSLFEGSYIVIERGMDSEATILLRSLMESLFSLGAITKDKDLAENFYQQHILLKSKGLSKLLESPSLTSGKDYTARLTELKKKVGERKIQQLTVEDLSKKAELHDFYTSAYPYFSWTVHSNILGIARHFQGDSDDQIQGVKWMPTTESLDKLFLTGIECIVVALRFLNSLFQLQEKECIEKFALDYQKLYKAHIPTKPSSGT